MKYEMKTDFIPQTILFISKKKKIKINRKFKLGPPWNQSNGCQIHAVFDQDRLEISIHNTDMHTFSPNGLAYVGDTVYLCPSFYRKSHNDMHFLNSNDEH